MNRRTLLAASPLAILAACTKNDGTATTPNQVAADVQGVVGALATYAPLIFSAAPKAFSPAQQAQINTDIALAQKGLNAFVPGMPAAAGASVVQTIDTYLNDAVAVLGSVVAPAVPALAPYVPIIAAVQALLPTIEGFVNQYIPAAKAGAPVRPMLPMSVADARAKLGVPVVQ